MGGRIQVPKQEMVVLGDRLNYIKSMLEHQQNHGRVVEELDERHGIKHVRTADEGFIDAWETAIKKLLEAIGGTGDLAKAIGVGATEIDSQVGEAGNQAANELAGFDLHS